MAILSPFGLRVNHRHVFFIFFFFLQTHILYPPLLQKETPLVVIGKCQKYFPNKIFQKVFYFLKRKSNFFSLIWWDLYRTICPHPKRLTIEHLTCFASIIIQTNFFSPSVNWQTLNGAIFSIDVRRWYS